MASATAAMTITTALSLPSLGHRQHLKLPAIAASADKAKPGGGRRIFVKASSAVSKEQAVAGLTAAALAAAMVIPEMAEAAQPGISPSLKNFLLSIVSGGVVLTAILGAVIGVANFDPVKRT